MTAVYLVVTEHGINSAHLDREDAEERARWLSAVVAEVPIVADYRWSVPATSDTTQEVPF